MHGAGAARTAAPGGGMTDAKHPRQRHGDRFWIRREDRKRILSEAGWTRDWTWFRGEGKGRRVLLGGALRSYAEDIQGRPLSHSSVYRVLRRHGWERQPVWHPPRNGPGMQGSSIRRAV